MTLRERILDVMEPRKGYTSAKVAALTQTPEDDAMMHLHHVRLKLAQLVKSDVLYTRRIAGRKFGMPFYTYHRRSAGRLRDQGRDSYGRLPRKPAVQGSSQERVLQVIAGLPPVFTPKELHAALGEEYQRITVTKWLERLQVRGKIVRVSHGKYRQV